MEQEKILNALRQVRDPKTGRDIVTADMVQNLVLDGNNVNFSLTIPSLQMQGKAELNFACIGAVAEVYPQAHVNVHFVASAAGIPEKNTTVPQIKNIIAVASGKGGVGKSTVAVNLALGLKKLGARVGLMDADVYGPSIPTMLGLVGQRPKIQDVTGQMKMVPLMAYDMPTISIGNIIEPDQAVVLRGPRLAAIIKQFFNDVLWSDLDFLIVDLPPGGSSPGRCAQGNEHVFAAANQRAHPRCGGKHVLVHARRIAKQQILPVRTGRRKETGSGQPLRTAGPGAPGTGYPRGRRQRKTCRIARQRRHHDRGISGSSPKYPAASSRPQ
jgi:metal-sulfur cluster biosynthetic enzyme